MVAMDEAGEAASSDEVVFTQILSLLKFDAGVVRRNPHRGRAACHAFLRQLECSAPSLGSGWKRAQDAASRHAFRVW